MVTIDIIRDKRTTCNKRVVPRRRNAKVAISLLVLIFIATTAFVYMLAPAATSRRPSYSATASVVLPASSAEAASPDKAILSDANLARAVGLISASGVEFGAGQSQSQSQSLAGQPAESIRGNLRVKRTEAASQKMGSSSGRRGEVSITYSGSGNPLEACRLVDLLAEQVALQDTDKRKAAAKLEHQKAKEEADSARNELFKAQAQYDAFLNQHFTTNRASKPASSSSPGPLPPATALSQPTPGLHFARPDWAEAPKSTTLKNPRWAELNNKFAALVARRASLLERMTQAHPDVQNIDLEIEDLKRKISSVPRELPPGGRDSLPPITPMPPNPTDDLLAPGGEGRPSRILANTPTRPGASAAATRPQTATPSELHPRLEKEFRQKQKLLDVARQRYNRLADRERQVWQALLDVHEAEVIPAVCPPAMSASASGRSSGLVLLASIVGLCGAAGIGLFSAGISPPACFENAAEVRAALKTPVVGTMAAVDSPESGECLHRPGIKRLTMVAAVLFLLAAVITTVLIVFSAG